MADAAATWSLVYNCQDLVSQRRVIIHKYVCGVSYKLNVFLMHKALNKKQVTPHNIQELGILKLIFKKNKMIITRRWWAGNTEC